MSAREVEQYSNGVQYQLFHSLGLIAVGLLMRSLRRDRDLAWTGWLFLLGMLLFSFPMYGISAFHQKWLGAVAPFGGLSFMLGWGVVVRAALGGWKSD
jgi:uncharacterized membrane protein YgdD (TMEM256/DUF423 family)